MESRVFRVKIISAFLKAGVAINKIDCFRSILEESSYRLTTGSHMAELIPVIRQEEIKTIQEELTGREILIVFDGTTRLGEVLVVLVRFLDSEWTIQQRLIRFLWLAKSFKGEEVAREIISVLAREYGIATELPVTAMHDRASVNSVALRTIKVIFPNILDIGCFSHTLDHVGAKFNTPFSHQIYEALDLAICTLTMCQTSVERSHWKKSQDIFFNKMVEQMGMHQTRLIPSLPPSYSLSLCK